MSQVPPDYEPQEDFSTIAAQPILTTGLPGTELDAEFALVATSVNALNSRLSEIQRDDGQIRNGMVKLFTLSDDVLALLAAAGANPRGIWASGESYETGDFVSVLTPALTVSGLTTTSAANGPYYQIGTDASGFPIFALNGDSSVGGYRVMLGQWVGGGGPPYETVWAVGEWADFLGTPTFTGFAFQEDGGDLPWSNPSPTWDAPAEADDPVITQGSDENLLANASYIALESHVSGGSFTDDIRYWGLIAAPPSAGNLVVDAFTGDGVETEFTLSQAPLNENNTQVYVAGVYIRKAQYSISGTTLTFAVAPANLAAIEVVVGVTVEVQTAVVADNSITEAKLVDAAVTTAKIADGSVTADKLAAGAAVPDDSISAAKLQSNSVEAAKIAAGAVTEGKLASGAVTEGKIGSLAVSATKLATGAVTSTKISDTAVTESKIAGGAVSTGKLADTAVTEGKLATDAVTNLKIAAGTIAYDRLNAASLAAGLLGINGIPKVNVRILLSGPTVVGTATNVASITNTATGKYRINFTTALADANYIPQVTLCNDRSAATHRYATVEAAADCTTTTCTITVRRTDTNNAAPPAGSEFLCVTIY